MVVTPPTRVDPDPRRGLIDRTHLENDHKRWTMTLPDCRAPGPSPGRYCERYDLPSGYAARVVLESQMFPVAGIRMHPYRNR